MLLATVSSIRNTFIPSNIACYMRTHTSTWRNRKHTMLKYFKGSLVIEDSSFLDLELGHKVNNFEQMVNRF